MNNINPYSTRENGITEIDVNTQHRLRDSSSTVIIDVREKGELPLLTGIAHRQIPMSLFVQSFHAIPEHTVILLCQHGVRSLYAAELLQATFGLSKKVYSLKGGLVKWGSDLREGTI